VRDSIRRSCEILISEGRVTIDGRVANSATGSIPTARSSASTDRCADGPEHRYFLLNKPDGVVTTASDPHGRPTVLELVESPVRIFPVGRLDMNTEGLLILTNDGRLAICSPIRVRGSPRSTWRALRATPRRRDRRLRDGVELEDGVTSPAQVSRVSEDSCVLSSTRAAIVRSVGCAPRSVTT